jgi:hypothetical protein
MFVKAYAHYRAVTLIVSCISSCIIVIIVIIVFSVQNFLIIILLLILSQNPPFVQKNGDELLEGFCIDLMKEITKITGYEYDMYVSPNGYGFNFHGRWTGIVGEIVKKVSYL